MAIKYYEYQWRGIDQFQRKQAGTLIAKNQEEAEQKLRSLGIKLKKLQRNFSFTRQAKNEQVTQLLNQCAVLLNAQVPLKQTLMICLENCQQISLYAWLIAILNQLDAGYAFSTTLKEQQQYLTTQEIQLLKIAELSGNLPKVLANIVESRQKLEKLTKKLKKILFYPVFVLCISLSLALFLLIFIVPEFAGIYADKAQNLPLVTSLLFNLSQLLQQYFVLVIMAVSIIISLTILFRQKFIGVMKYKVLAKLLVFKQIIQQSRIVFFSQNLALMLTSGLHLNSALASFVSEGDPDSIFQQEIDTMLNVIKQGYPFSIGISAYIFSHEFKQMVVIGEQSGNMSTMLLQVADIYQQKLDHQIDLLAQMLEPLLMLFIGAIVGTIIIGLYLPIFDMGAMVQ